MKPAHKQLILAGLLATLGFTAGAQTPPPPPGAPAPGMMQRDGGRDHGRMREHMREHMQERMAKRMAMLKQKLQITPAQEGAWTTYTNALKPTGAMMQRPDRREFEKLTTPERIDKMRAMRSARMVEMDKRAEATKTFYAALSPEQKKTFDEITSRMGSRGHRGFGGHGGHHRF